MSEQPSLLAPDLPEGFFRYEHNLGAKEERALTGVIKRDRTP